MKIKSILMTILLAVGFIAAKAATGYPPELVLVSQPVMTYNDYSNTLTVYYDVQNIGDYRYKGYVYIYLDPDDGYYYAKKRVKVCPGRIKRIAIDIPAYRPNPSYTYTIMPYYELGDELYSFTTFEYFDPLAFRWNGPRNEYHVVINLAPVPRYYNRPGTYRYYYDGYRPPMPPPPPPGFAGPAPAPHILDPAHHTYHYHYNNGGYPATHNFSEGAHVHDSGNNNPSSSGNGQATVRPNNNGTPGSMSSNGAGNNNQNNFNGSSNNGATVRPNGSPAGNNSGVSRPSSGNNNGATTRPNSGNSGVSSGSTSRPSSGVGSGSNNGSNRPSSGSSSVGRTSSSSSSSSATTARPSSGNSSSNRSGSTSSSGSTRTSSSSSSSSRSSATSSSSNSSSRSSSSSSSSSRSGNSSTGARR